MGAIAEDVKRSATLQAVNDNVGVNQPGIATITATLVITGTNTTIFEAQNDEGASPTWTAIKALNVNTGSLVSSVTATGLFKIDASGYRAVRAKCSNYTNGSIVATLNASAAPCAPGLISAAAGGAGASTIADGADVAEGSTTDVAVTGDNAGTNSAKLRGLNKLFADVWDSTNHWLQVKLMAGAAIIGAVTQSGTWTVQPGNTANTTAWKVDNSAVTQPISAVSLPLPTGAALDATIGTTNTQVGGLTETAPASDTASSGLNGRLQRVAQRITSLIALLPTALVSNRLDVNLGAAPATVTVAALPTGTNSIGTVVQGTQGAGGTASWNVQGAATAGAAVAGNPVLLGGSDGVNAQTLKTAPAVLTAAANTGALYVQMGLADTATNLVPAQSIKQTSSASGSGQNVMASGQVVFNNTNFDTVRNNTTTVVQASTLTTAQTINTDITNYNGRAFMAHANVTIYNGGTITMTLQWKDANGVFVNIPGATTGAVASGADVFLNVGPTVWPANTATMFNVNFFLPRNIRLVTVIATASVTFSQSYDLPAN